MSRIFIALAGLILGGWIGKILAQQYCDPQMMSKFDIAFFFLAFACFFIAVFDTEPKR